jgi:hypothetical protein
VFLAAVVAAVVPVVVAAVRAMGNGWVPVNDDALIAIRARDVFTVEHQPLLGLWSSASASAGTDLNHPGPLLFELLALPVRIVDGGGGVALGVALVNVAAIVGVAVFAYRRGGAVVGTAAMAVTAGLSWSFGSEVLYEPWSPHSVLLPFLFFLVLVWSAACGDRAALPFAVAAGSLVIQTHLSYAFLVPALGVWGVGALAFELRRRRRVDPGGWPGERRSTVRWALLAVAVGVLCWLPPLIEQVTGDGRGNLSRLVSSTADPTHSIGFGLAGRLVGSVVALPPFWFRSSFRDAFLAADSPDGWRPTSVPVAVLALSLVVGVLALGAWDARRRRDRDTSLLLVTGAVALVVGVFTAARVPVNIFGAAPHQFRFIWVIAAFVWLAVIVAVARRWAAVPARRTGIVGALAVVTVALAVANLPANDQGTVAPPGSVAVARDLNRQLAGLDVDGTLYVTGSAAFGDPHGSSVLAELDRQGIPFVLGQGLIEPRQLGPDRGYTGENADQMLTVAYGDDAATVPPGARRVALHEALTPAEQRELDRLERRVRAYIAGGNLRLDDRGRTALANGALPLIEADGAAGVDPDELLASRELAFLARHDLLVLDDAWAARFDRYASLRDEWDANTVALYLGPLDET